MQNHTNGEFQFTRTLDRKPTGNAGEWDSEWTGKLTQVPSGYTMAPATLMSGAGEAVLYKLTTVSKSYFPKTSTESFSNGVSFGRTFSHADTPWDTTGVGRMQNQTTSTGTQIKYGYESHADQPEQYNKMLTREWSIKNGSGGVVAMSKQSFGYSQTSATEPYSIPLRFDFRPRLTALEYDNTNPNGFPIPYTKVSRQFARFCLQSSADGDEYTEIHETDVSPGIGAPLYGNNYGNSANLRTVERYYSASHANLLLRGRLREVVHSDGTRTRYTYTAPATGELLETIDDNLLPSTGAPTSSSVRVENRYDVRGCLLWGVHSRWTGLWQPYERFDLTWDNYTNITQQKRTDLFSDQEVILLEQEWDGALLKRTIDAAGVAHRYTYFPSSIIVQSIKREAVPASGAIPAQPEVVTTYTGQFTMNTTQLPVWKNLTATVTDGTSSVATAMVLDHLGRITSVTDDNGYTTSTSYSANGTAITSTYPSGATRTESRSSDGTLLSVTGSAQVHEFYTSQARGGNTGGMIHTTTVGASGGPRWFRSEIDGAGRQVKTSSPSYSGRSVISLVSASGKLWEVSESMVYPTAGSGVSKMTGKTRRLLAGFTGDERSVTESIDMAGNTVSSKSFLNRSQRLATQTTTVPGVSDHAVSVQYAGRPYSTHQSGSTGNTIFTQDGLGRLLSVKQPHHAASESIVYDSGKNRILSESDATGASTSYTYVAQGQPGAGGVLTATAPDSTATAYTYDAVGRVTTVSGTGTYNVTYEYTSYGELWKMRTFRIPSAPGDLTTWNYQPATGLLLNKTDANGQAVAYEYDVANRPSTRAWARGGSTTTWSYNFGRVYQISYSDGTTPGSTFIFDRLGRPASTTQGSHSWVYAYDSNTLLPDTETITYGGGIARVIDRDFDTLRRFTGWSLKTSIAGSTELNYVRSYEPVAGPLGTITSGSDTWTYGYEPAAPRLPKTLTGPGSRSMTNTWEPNRDVLDIKENKFGATTVSKYDYTVNPMGRRSNLAQTGTAYGGGASLAWGYNPRGEVTLHDHSTAAYDRVYEFDGIGNRTKGATGTTPPASNDTVSNALNQYTTFPGASGSLTYDLDGNLTADGGANSNNAARTYSWDGENQLKQVTATTLGTAQYAYDPMGRRIQKTAGGVTTWYLYDGWNLIAEYQSSTLQRTHLWGTDLSGTAQGAGGVGGLLCTSISGTPYYPFYDGNGNICQYLNASGSTTATFEYGPFGALNASAGSPALFNFRFSTKYLDPETDNYYYGYRYYSTWMGRWVNRDPIGESGGENLYGMVVNNLLNRMDGLGLRDCSCNKKPKSVAVSNVEWSMEHSISSSGNIQTAAAAANVMGSQLSDGECIKNLRMVFHGNSGGFSFSSNERYMSPVYSPKLSEANRVTSANASEIFEKFQNMFAFAKGVGFIWTPAAPDRHMLCWQK